MGVVYKALDTRLKRTVALKFLRTDLTRDPEANEPFTREARPPLPFSWPRGTDSYRITQDGKAVTYVEYESNSKLMLWEDPFIWE